MNLFRKMSVCFECQVFFKPVTGYEARWGHLCATHRKPVMERDLRRDAVVDWAKTNWEKLEPEYLKDAEERAKAYADVQRAGLNSIAGLRQGGFNSSELSQYGFS